jgi:hypothetical protein
MNEKENRVSAELIRKHFVQFLGTDVGVSFKDAQEPREVVLYRPDRLSDAFVQWAFEALENAVPDAAARIDRLVVSYETRLGRTQRGVSLVRKDTPSDSASCSEPTEQEPSGIVLPFPAQTLRFYASRCSVCGELALEACVTTQELEIECGHCGGYRLTIEERSNVTRLSQRERKAWLGRIRQRSTLSRAAG